MKSKKFKAMIKRVKRIEKVINIMDEEEWKLNKSSREQMMIQLEALRILASTSISFHDHGNKPYQHEIKVMELKNRVRTWKHK